MHPIEEEWNAMCFLCLRWKIKMGTALLSYNHVLFMLIYVSISVPQLGWNSEIFPKLQLIVQHRGLLRILPSVPINPVCVWFPCVATWPVLLNGKSFHCLLVFVLLELWQLAVLGDHFHLAFPKPITLVEQNLTVHKHVTYELVMLLNIHFSASIWYNKINDILRKI